MPASGREKGGRRGRAGGFFPLQETPERQVVSSSLSLSLTLPSVLQRSRLLRAPLVVSVLLSHRFVAASLSPSPTSSFSTLPDLSFSLATSRAWCKLLGASHPASTALLCDGGSNREEGAREGYDIGADVVVGIGGGARLSLERDARASSLGWL